MEVTQETCDILEEPVHSFENNESKKGLHDSFDGFDNQKEEERGGDKTR